jgi:hypothetical protein
MLVRSRIEAVVDTLAGTAPNTKSGLPHAYNLFRHRDKRHLVCAVAEDCPVPWFIAGPAWEYADKISEWRAAPIEFSPRAAAEGMRLNGFYLFLTFNKGPGAAADIDKALNTMAVGTRS